MAKRLLDFSLIIETNCSIFDNSFFRLFLLKNKMINFCAKSVDLTKIV